MINYRKIFRREIDEVDNFINGVTGNIVDFVADIDLPTKDNKSNPSTGIQVEIPIKSYISNDSIIWYADVSKAVFKPDSGDVTASCERNVYDIVCNLTRDWIDIANEIAVFNKYTKLDPVSVDEDILNKWMDLYKDRNFKLEIDPNRKLTHKNGLVASTRMMTVFIMKFEDDGVKYYSFADKNAREIELAEFDIKDYRMRYIVGMSIGTAVQNSYIVLQK